MLCRDVWSHIHEHLDIFSILRMSQVDTYHLKIFDKRRERINFCKFNLELACEYLELPYVKDLYFSLIERRNLWSVWEYLVGKKTKPLFDYERGLYCASRGEKRSTIVWILELADIQNNRIFATILHNVWADRSIDYAKCRRLVNHESPNEIQKNAFRIFVIHIFYRNIQYSCYK